MTHIIDEQTVDLLQAMAVASESLMKINEPAALLAGRAGMVEMLDVAADFIAMQRRLLDERPVAPTLQKLMLARHAPEAPEDGDTWGDFKTGKLMVAQGGKWLDPAEGIKPARPPATKPRPLLALAPWIDRLALFGWGFLTAFIVLN